MHHRARRRPRVVEGGMKRHLLGRRIAADQVPGGIELAEPGGIEPAETGAPWG
jgi:hypothetical protein